MEDGAGVTATVGERMCSWEYKPPSVDGRPQSWPPRCELNASEDGLCELHNAWRDHQTVLDWAHSLPHRAARRIRERAGYSAVELARTIGTTPRTLQAWEMGHPWAGRSADFEKWARLLMQMEDDWSVAYFVACLGVIAGTEPPELLSPPRVTGTPPSLTPSDLRRVSQARKIGQEARALRESAYLSLREVADEVGVSARTLQRWETGQHSPRTHSAIRWMKVLDGVRAVIGKEPE